MSFSPTASGDYKSKFNLHRVNKNIMECFSDKPSSDFISLIDDDDCWVTSTERQISLGAHCRFMISMTEALDGTHVERPVDLR